MAISWLWIRWHPRSRSSPPADATSLPGAQRPDPAGAFVPQSRWRALYLRCGARRDCGRFAAGWQRDQPLWPLPDPVSHRHQLQSGTGKRLQRWRQSSKVFDSFGQLLQERSGQVLADIHGNLLLIDRQISTLPHSGWHQAEEQQPSQLLPSWRRAK